MVLYETAAGRVPFDGATNSDVIVSILDRDPEPLSHVDPGYPDDMSQIITKALRKERGERYQTAREMSADLLSFRVHASACRGLNG